MPGQPLPDDASGLRAANAGLRAVVEAKDAENALLRAELDAERELRRRLELRLAELERRLGMDSTDSGTPSSKERTGAKEARRARQQSERERSKDRKRGGQPGHQGKGLKRDPDPSEKKDAPPPAECRSCKAPLEGAESVEPRWAQVIDVEFVRKVTEWALPGLLCPCCGTVTFAGPPPGAHAGSVSYGPALNAAAVLLSCYGNVPPERSAQVIGMHTGYQHLLSRLAGIQQCAQHVIRCCRAVAKPGPGSLQDWAADVIAVLRDAHHAVEEARARGSTSPHPPHQQPGR